jgi:predicted component of type VI protein secretion system
LIETMADELVLRVVARAGERNATPIVAHFDASGGLIGRADTARLVLPDAKRTVSRFHAHVSYADSAYFIEDMGSPNPALVNGQSLAPGQKIELKRGDQLRVGDYTLAVGFHDPDSAAASGFEQDSLRPDDISERTQLVPRLGSTGGGQARAPATGDELWAGFSEGAQVRIDLPHGAQPELMRVIGVLLRASVIGLRRLLQIRAAAKRDVDADVTQIRTRNNNPLKFASDDARALAALLKPPMHGFMPGPTAIQDAVDDLESHGIASAAALRVAMQETLTRFDPETLTQRLTAPGVLDSLVPMSRKAKLWELYLDQHRAIRREAEESFEDVFTRAFAEAYEGEVARMKAHRS